jgi:PAS domain S-box-containing protein
MTDAKDPEAWLAKERGLFEQILASLTSGVIAVDGEGVVLTVNPAACTQLGIAQTTLRPGVPLVDITGAGPFLEALAEMKETCQPISRRELIFEENGGRRTIGMTASLLHGPQAFNGAVFLFVDLTEVRALERAASINRQLAEIGELTAGVVHELRNPLSVISGMTELLARRLGDDEGMMRRVETILKEVRLMDVLISQFLGFAKPFELARIRCTAEEILDRTMLLCERTAKVRDVTILLNTQNAPLYLNADPGRLAQALSNILRNALELTPPGGQVTLSIAITDQDLVFRVEDEGPGIHLKEGESLITPFFSKREGGTGLGLSIVHRIVTAHGGSVSYGNRALPPDTETRGAWFEIRLPAAEKDA